MRFLCLCPTYGRPPNLIREAISHFINQTHTNAYLLVYDDLGNYQVHTGDRWAVLSTSCREPGIVAKYETMLRVARHIEQVGTIDAIALWDDDDVYLPKHLEHHARVLDRYEFSYPSKVLSTYTGTIAEEASGGRFWASCAIRAKSFSDVGGFVRTERADFDQQSLGRWLRQLSHGDPCAFGDPTYIFRWGDTGVPHSQGHMRSPDDTEWYRRIVPAWTLRESLYGQTT